MSEPEPAAAARQSVVLVRHGETEWAAEGRHTGRTDVPLTAHGRDEARCLPSMLAGRRFTRVLVSPLWRARETCALAGYGAAAEVTPDLLEWDYGAYEGRTTAEILAERPGWSLWDDGVPRTAGSGETVEEVGARADRVIAEVLATRGDVALFAHGHVLRILTARWLQFPPREGRRFALDAAGVCTLGYEHDSRVIHTWNELCPEARPPEETAPP